jgi:hypothetical protein
MKSDELVRRNSLTDEGLHIKIDYNFSRRYMFVIENARRNSPDNLYPHQNSKPLPMESRRHGIHFLDKI